MLFAIVWCLNFGISIFNAVSVGAVWSEIKALHDGWLRMVAWCGAIMSACGFIWCYAILEALVFHSMGKLNRDQVDALLSLSYLAIIIPVIGSGMGITAFSLAEFARRRTVGSAIRAGYNSFAQVHNTYRAIRDMPTASKGIGDLFKSKDGKGTAGLVVILLFLAALVLGIFTTWGLIRWADRRWVLNIGEELDRKLESSRRSQTA